MRESDMNRLSESLVAAGLYYYSLAQLLEVLGVSHSLRSVLNGNQVKINHNVLEMVGDTLSRITRKLKILVTEFDRIAKTCF